MTINLTDFYDVNNVSHWTTSIGVSMYNIELVSKSTGEVITWSFTEEYFDKLLDEMEQEYNGLKAHYEYISWVVKRRSIYEQAN
jgi:hypothetical protein